MKQPESLQDFAMDFIRRNIQNGVYPAKSKLAPQHIAAELNISSTPVVAALNRLVTQGGNSSPPGVHRQGIFHRRHFELF